MVADNGCLSSSVAAVADELFFLCELREWCECCELCEWWEW